MNPKDIKVGNFYHVLVKVLEINPKNGEFTTETVNEFGTSLNMEPTYFARCEAEAFFPITPENERKNSEPAPKYDPCRLFKAGDIVRIIDWNGRTPDMLDEKGTREAVVADPEDPRSGCVELLYNDRYPIVAACFLELITPVEELEPYYVEEECHSWCVRKPEPSGVYSTLSWFSKNRHPNAKAAADAECARLNAEYRKEQNNG